MPPSFRPGLTSLEDRTVPSVTTDQVFAAAAQADLGQQQLQQLIEKKVEFLNVYTVAFLQNYLPTLTDQNVKAGKVLAEYQNALADQAATDPSVIPLISRVAEERYKAEVNAVYAVALTSAVGGIPLGGASAPTTPIPPDQAIPPTPPPVVPPPPSPPAPTPIDTTTNAGTTGVLPDLTAAGFRDLGTGVRVNDVIVGQGNAAKAGQDVNVFYTGFLTDGTVFDGNRTGSPTTFNLNGVVQGFNQGLQGMQPGGVRQIFIPSALGYGPSGSGSSIPPNADLIFEVKLLSATDPAVSSGS